jgi:iron(III) transport system substrate-binding protein
LRGWTRPAILFWLAALALGGGCMRNPDAAARVPDNYPASYADTIESGEREAALVIWSATDARQVRDLLADFRRLYPRIAVDYRDTSARALYDHFLAESAAGRPTADLLWTSAMDLQIKLVNDGYAQSYASPEKAALPDWANWKDQAWGITAEPIVMVYNRRLFPQGAPLASHLDFLRLLEMRSPALDGKVATYDPGESAVGYLYLSQDDLVSRHLWRTVQGLGANHVRLFTTTEAIIEDVSTGRSAIGYNVVGSYAIDEMRRNPDLVVVQPRDYTLVMSRIAMIPVHAPHPNAARLFLDYLLSARGQRHLVAHSMPSVRSDVAMPEALRPGAVPIRAIRVGPALLVVQDQLTRRGFMNQWSRSIAAGANGGTAGRAGGTR